MEKSRIREKMRVVAADGSAVGYVTRVQGEDSLHVGYVKNGHGFEHLIPMTWVSEVDRYVFLNKGSRFVLANWETVPGTARAA